jgi:hypothetical protein
MADVEAFDALGTLGQAESILQRFLNCAGIRLQDAKTLIVGLLRVVAGEIDEFAFVSALRDGNVDARETATFAGELLA